MKKIILTTFLLAMSSFAFAQTSPADFEAGGIGADWTWEVFENGTNPAVEVIDNPDATGANTSAKVAKFSNLAAGQPWAGAWTEGAGVFKFSASNSIIKLKVWKSVISDVGIKFEKAGGGEPIIPEIRIPNTTTNAWEEMTFDFSAHIGDNEYGRLVIFLDFKDGRTDNDAYFDDLTFEAQPAPPAPPQNLFFSEYIEGSSNNKALEIYNPSDVAVSLADYRIMQASNGNGWAFYHTFKADATIAAGGTYVLITDQVNTELFDHAKADEVLAFPSPIHFNGDDARAIIYIAGNDTTILDTFGDPDNDPGSAWNVGATAGATANKTLVRKASVISGNPMILGSFGTDDASSEWEVKDVDDFSNLGTHVGSGSGPMMAPAPLAFPAEDVIALHAAGYTGATVDTWRTDWSSATYSEVITGGRAVKKYSAMDFVGIETVANQINASEMTHFHFDAWTSDGTQISIKLVDFGADGAFGGGDDVEHQLDFATPEQGKWNTYHIPLSDFTGLTSKANIAQYIFVAQPTGTATVFLDNMAFHKVPKVTAVDVTFTVNTASLLDTLRADNGIMYLNGQVKTADGQVGTLPEGEVLGWDTNATATLENVGGDYWSATFTLTPGDTLQYKYRYAIGEVNSDENDFTTAGNPNGWGTRYLVVPENNVVLDVDYWNDRGNSSPDGNRNNSPFGTVDAHGDSLGLVFRVNVAAAVQQGGFVHGTSIVGVRGTPGVLGNPADWSSSAVLLEREANSDFYSGLLRLDPTWKDSTGDGFAYKFVYGAANDGSVSWESFSGDRNGNIPAADSTFHWDYFSREAPSATVLTANVSFQANMSLLSALEYTNEFGNNTNFFNSTLGDTVFLRGAATSADWGSQKGVNDMVFNPELLTYERNVSLVRSPGDLVKYKYFIKYAPERSDTTSAGEPANEDHFIRAIFNNVDFGYEEPASTGGGDRFYEFGESEQQVNVKEFNDIGIGALIEQEDVVGGNPLQLTFRVDMTPSLAQSEGGLTNFDPANDSVFVQMESKYTALTWGIESGGSLFSNATSAEDLALVQMSREGESNFWSVTIELPSPTINDFQWVITYGQPLKNINSMQTNGDGFDKGRRYGNFIDPVAVREGATDPFFGQLYNVEWPSTFTFDVEWKQKDLPVDDLVDYAGLVGVSNERQGTPDAFGLKQNFPNPFNPSTNIQFNIPQSSQVSLEVYNLLGQRVAVLLQNQLLPAGTHGVTFDASNLASGMYIYRLKAGNMITQKSMTLIK